MRQQIINKFFRGNPMETRKLQELQESFTSELAALESGKGCSRCKKNGLRRKYKNKITKLLDEK